MNLYELNLLKDFPDTELQINSHNQLQSDLEPAENEQYNLNLERLCGIEVEHMQINQSYIVK